MLPHLLQLLLHTLLLKPLLLLRGRCLRLGIRLHLRRYGSDFRRYCRRYCTIPRQQLGLGCVQLQLAGPTPRRSSRLRCGSLCGCSRACTRVALLLR